MRFSIITITKNNPTGFEKTKQSVSAQIYQDYEWVIIDGDKEPDNGIYDAMNKGIERATGDYIIFMNAGDAFANGNVLMNLSQYHADFIYGDAIEGGYIKPSKYHSKISGGMITHHQAMVYRRDVVGDLRFDEGYKIAADYKFTFQFLKRCKTVLQYNQVICDFEMGGVSQIMAKKGRMEQAQIRAEMGVKKPLTNFRQWFAQSVRDKFPMLYLKIRMIANKGANTV